MLLAAEPMTVNATRMAIDDQRRFLVCEAVIHRLNYNLRRTRRQNGNRIVMPAKGDGTEHRCTVFCNGPASTWRLACWSLGPGSHVSCRPGLRVFTDSDGEQRLDLMDTPFTGRGSLQDDYGVFVFAFEPGGKLRSDFGNAGRPSADAMQRLVQGTAEVASGTYCGRCRECMV